MKFCSAHAVSTFFNIDKATDYYICLQVTVILPFDYQCCNCNFIHAWVAKHAEML